MNATEKKGLDYIINVLGFDKELVRFHPSSSPDFTVGDKGFEVKRLGGNTISFRPRQWQYLLDFGNCTILAFTHTGEFQGAIPISIIPRGTPSWGKFRFWEESLERPNQMTRCEYLARFQEKKEAKGRKMNDTKGEWRTYKPKYATSTYCIDVKHSPQNVQPPKPRREIQRIAVAYRKADADLIAAAPEMYKALKTVIEAGYPIVTCTQKEFGSIHITERAVLGNALERALAALAKAEGKAI